jgi:hypothetical protein
VRKQGRSPTRRWFNWSFGAATRWGRREPTESLVVASAGDGHCARRKVGHGEGAHARSLVDAGVAGRQQGNALAGGDQLECLLGVGGLGDDSRGTVGGPLVDGEPEFAKIPGGARQGDEGLVEQLRP